MRRWFVALAFVVAGCASVEPDGLIRIEHPRYQFGAAELQASIECSKQGKKVRHLMTEPAKMSVVLIETRISTFTCIE